MRHSSSDDEEMLEVDSQEIANMNQFIWGQFMDNESSRLAQKKYLDHSEPFNAYLLINNYSRTVPWTEEYVKNCIGNYILYMKPDINYKDEHTNRNFYNYIVRDKWISENMKVALTSVWIKVYEGIDHFFSKDIYGYTSFHYALVLNHYKIALQILLYCSKHSGFELSYQISMENTHEFHEHPLTFFIWKNSENGIKKDSKREKVLKILLHYSDNDVLLVKNKDGFSSYEYLLNVKNKKHTKHMLSLICSHQLKWKYLFMLRKSKWLKKVNDSLKMKICQYLA